MLKTKIDELNKEYDLKRRIERRWYLFANLLLLIFLIVAIIFGKKLLDFTDAQYKVSITHVGGIGGGLINHFPLTIMSVASFIMIIAFFSLPKGEYRVKALTIITVTALVLMCICGFLLIELPHRSIDYSLKHDPLVAADPKYKMYIGLINDYIAKLHTIDDLYIYFASSIAVGLVSMIPFLISLKYNKKLVPLKEQIDSAKTFANELEEQKRY